MATIEPTGKILGATIRDVDLARAVSDRDFAEIMQALGEHGVLRFPAQELQPADLARFSRRFGGLQSSVTGTYCEPGMPEVMILSNIVENGEPIGLADAGQDWHTDMSYNEVIGFVNVLYGLKVPHRDGKPLGSTVFANMHAAYDELPEDMKSRLEGRMVVHDFNKFWEEMRRRPGSTRPPLTPEQRAKRPPARHPAFLVHPITGRRVLYANPGYAIQIEGMEASESDALLERLFAHQLQPKYQYVHEWTVGDVLIWDHIGTLHNAIPDYRADEHRLMKRCQVMADRIFDPGFVKAALAPLAVAAE
jgi:taurine dioxygenase